MRISLISLFFWTTLHLALCQSSKHGGTCQYTDDMEDVETREFVFEARNEKELQSKIESAFAEILKEYPDAEVSIMPEPIAPDDVTTQPTSSIHQSKSNYVTTKNPPSPSNTSPSTNDDVTDKSQSNNEVTGTTIANDVIDDVTSISSPSETTQLNTTFITTMPLITEDTTAPHHSTSTTTEKYSDGMLATVALSGNNGTTAHPVISEAPSKFTDAETLCTSKGWELANIRNFEQYNKTVVYVRQKIWPGFQRDFIRLWTGMKYMDNQLQLRSGEPITMPSSVWAIGFPGNMENVDIAIQVMENIDQTRQGLVNEPEDHYLDGALCEES